MSTHRRFARCSPLFALALLSSACAEDPGQDDDAGTTTSVGSDATASDDDVSTEADSDTATFDIPPETTACELFSQTCPENEKCVPYAMGGGSWDALKCVPITGDKAPGETCELTSIESGIDDCDGTSYCWDDSCREMCTGSANDPQCPPQTECMINGSSIIALCLPTCDPLLQNCAEGQGCVWSGTEFDCLESQGSIPVGETCEFLASCVTGGLCIDNEWLPGCEGDYCCSLYCALDAPDICDSVHPGTACLPFFEEGAAPPDLENTGFCGVF